MHNKKHYVTNWTADEFHFFLVFKAGLEPQDLILISISSHDKVFWSSNSHW